MKYIIILLLSTSLFPQINKPMLDMTNIYRDHYGKKSLKWSNDIFNVSKTQLINTVENDIKYDSLYHINDTLEKYNLSEILLSKYFDNYRYDRNSINPFVDIRFYFFCKTHFKSVYNKNLVKIKIIKKISDNRYIIDKMDNDVYVYNNKYRRGIISVDSTIGDKTYVRTMNINLSKNDKIKVSPYNTSLLKNELFVIELLKQWNDSPLHKKILLSDNEFMAGDIIIKNDMVYSLMNFK